MNYCSSCGSSRIVFEIPEGDNRTRFCCKNCGTIHYQNPRVVVGCLATFEDKILLAKRNIHPRKGFWNLPAGFLENGETIEEGAAREVFEETKAEVNIIRPHCLYNLTKANQLYIHFLAELKSPYYETTPESSEVALLRQEEIPWNDIAFTSSTFALEKFFAFKDKAFEGIHQGSWEPTA